MHARARHDRKRRLLQEQRPARERARRGAMQASWAAPATCFSRVRGALQRAAVTKQGARATAASPGRTDPPYRSPSASSDLETE